MTGPRVHVVTGVRVAGAVQVPGTSVGPGVIVVPGTGAQGAELNDLVDVDTTDAPAGTPLTLRRDPTDGIYRLEPATAAPTWGDQVRFAAGPPADTAAPDGAVHVDVTARRIYQHRSSST